MPTLADILRLFPNKNRNIRAKTLPKAHNRRHINLIHHISVRDRKDRLGSDSKSQNTDDFTG